jgi:hypothetical protein
MLHFALCLDGKLYVVTIGPFEQTHPFDLLERKSCHTLFPVPNHPQASNVTAIGEADMLPIRLNIRFPNMLLSPLGFPAR